MKLSRALLFVSASLAITAAAAGGCSGGGAAAPFVGPGPGGNDGGLATGPDGAPIVPNGDGGVSLLTDAPVSFGNDSGGYADATPDVVGDGACLVGDAGPPVYPQKCAPPTTNECTAATDGFLKAGGIPTSMLNGAGGNGFDDDCDGLVDEGCTCTTPGATKNCYLVPPSQIDQATGAPVGWCTTNSLGSLDCAGSEFSQWSGTCRGARPPYAHDICAVGDFNCDGVPENSDVQNCTCQSAPVTCPTAAITEAPYPAPTNITPVDGTAWIGGGQVTKTTGWKWTVMGGDCDNVLPNPTFAMYSAKDTTLPSTNRLGTRTPVTYSVAVTPNEYVATAGAPLVSVQATTGSGAAGAVVYPAFALSGNYVVQGEFDLDGTHYVCTQQVQVRAPGLRAELCWDTVGQGGGESPSAGSSPPVTGANDIDIHFARLQGTTCTTSHGWDSTCTTGTSYEDCWYDSISGCRDTSSTGPGWGYADSPQTACIGWGSERTSTAAGGSQGCTNPRLDRDNITCDPSITDPSNTGSFCGPENINLDNPKNGDAFVVSVNHYNNTSGSSRAHTHANIYCNGARVVSSGYNPLTAGSAATGPLLVSGGGDLTGDIWEVATVKWNTGNPLGCDITTVPSASPDAVRDGTANKSVCVDSATAPAPTVYTNHKFIEATGAIPTTAAGFCKH
jgi:hypothetical protein